MNADFKEEFRAKNAKDAKSAHVFRVLVPNLLIGNALVLEAPASSGWPRNSAWKLITIRVFILLFPLCAQAATPDRWPVEIKLTQPADASPYPAELNPAAQFQKTFLKILASGTSKAQPFEPDWVNELRAFIAADREDDPIAHSVAEVARAWFARVQMRTIDAALRQYYRQNVRFPDRFSAIETSLPEALRLDPWGQPWSYQPRAPQGFAKLTGQRYQLGPAKFPELGPLVHRTTPALPAWKFTLRNLGDKRALEIRIAATTTTLQPGGKTGDYTLVYLGDNWVLMAGPDQLFAVTF